jgi:hypothetical protein
MHRAFDGAQGASDRVGEERMKGKIDFEKGTIELVGADHTPGGKK